MRLTCRRVEDFDVGSNRGDVIENVARAGAGHCAVATGDEGGTEGGAGVTAGTGASVAIMAKGVGICT